MLWKKWWDAIELHAKIFIGNAVVHLYVSKSDAQLFLPRIEPENKLILKGVARETALFKACTPCNFSFAWGQKMFHT